jgi:4'-phosphopantetheinyl transferase
VVWTVDLALDVGNWMVRLLAPDELRRADRLQNSAARARWMVSRAALRLILARHSGIDSAAIRFRCGALGKPALQTSPEDRRGLHFSLSRSDDACLIAVSADGPVGVDIESVPTTSDGDAAIEGVARQFFHARELAPLRALERMQRRRALLQLWTRKEAYAKATGTGLQLDLAALDLSDERVSRERPATRDQACRVDDLPQTADRVGALALCGTATRPFRTILRTFSLSEIGASAQRAACVNA